MESGWASIDGHWYHMDQWGAMETGWTYTDNNWYYLNSWGAMETGWVVVNGYWYHMNQWGAMETGWQYVGDDCYYLRADGSMAASTWVDGYYVDASGRWVNRKKKEIPLWSLFFCQKRNRSRKFIRFCGNPE